MRCAHGYGEPTAMRRAACFYDEAATREYAVVLLDGDNYRTAIYHSRTRPHQRDLLYRRHDAPIFYQPVSKTADDDFIKFIEMIIESRHKSGTLRAAA